MILVTGATGQLGNAVVRQLLARSAAKEVAALVRDEAKAAPLAALGVSLRVGNYDDPAALDRAMVGVERVLLIASNEPPRRVQQHQNVIDAAKRAGVKLFGFASRSLKNIKASENTLMGHYFETEARIVASGLPHVIFRNALYLDTVPLYVGGARVFETGIRLPAEDGKVAYALRREMGEALANGMVDAAGGNRTFVVSAPRAYSFTDVAAALSEMSGKTVGYSPVTDVEYVQNAVKAGLPEAMAQRFLGFYSDIRNHQLDETSADLATLLGREPASLVDGLRELFK